MAVILLTDSSTDYELQEVKQKNLLFVPITVIFNDKPYLDGIELSKEDFYARLQNGEYPTTSQPSPQDFLSAFEQAKAQGDELVAILLSSSLSGTVQSALLAKNMVDYEGIHIVDSLSAVTDIRLLVDTAVSMRDSGHTAKDIVDTLEELKGRVHVHAGLATLEYLYKGGRLTKMQAGIGEAANLRPIITVDQTGHVSVLAKTIGKKKAISQIVKMVLAANLDPAYPLYFIYAHDKTNCLELIEALRKNGFTLSEEHLYNIGPTIAAHVGVGAFGVTFVTKE